MHSLRSPALLLSLGTLLCGAGCSPGSGRAAPHAAHEREPTSTTVFGERLLLFMEYPHLVRGEPVRFLAHLTVLASGEPVRSGSVTLELGAARFTSEAPRREGLFLPEGAPPEPGTQRARLIVTSEQASETLELGELVVHADEHAADLAAHAASADDPPDAVPFLMEPQWKVRLLLARAAPRALSERLGVPARAVVPEGLSAVVSAPLAGRLLAPASGRLARSGEAVAAGQSLAQVEPPLGAAELAQLRALEFEFDLRVQTLVRATLEARTRLQFAQREHERILALRAEGLSTQQALEQAEQALALARTELEAAGRMQETSLALLLERREGGSSALRFELAAPIAGSVVEVLGVPGLSLEAGAPVFRILDSSRVWVEGRLSEFDLPLLGPAPRAVARFAALPGRVFELSGPQDGAPYLGREVDPASRTLLVRFAIDNPDGAVRPGMLADLHITTGEHAAAVAIPLEAVVMDQGLPSAYVMLSGEMFQRRDLELGVRDGAFVEVLRGVAAGERVAARGAYIVKLAAHAPTSFGAGHAH